MPASKKKNAISASLTQCESGQATPAGPSPAETRACTKAWYEPPEARVRPRERRRGHHEQQVARRLRSQILAEGRDERET
jgi:hypothetical protein